MALEVRALPRAPGLPLIRAGAPVIAYGQLLNSVIDFLIIAFVVFIISRQVKKIHRAPVAEPAAPTTKDCPFCCTQIPLAASRCPHCTSQLGTAASA